jgi:choline dehydrogenase-like flavoprotein
VTATIYEIDPSIASPEMLRFDHDLASAALKEYQATQSGVLTAIPSSIAYLPCSTLMPAIAVTSLAQRAAKLVGADHPLAKQFTYSNPSGGVGQMEYNFDVSNYSDEYVSEKGKRYATMLQMLQYPFSKGSIHIPPLSPAMQIEGKRKVTVDDKPAIDPRYYLGSGGEIDFQIMVAAQKFGTKITATPPLSTIILRRVFPPETSSFEEEDEVLEEFVRNHTITDWHPVGTCGMGGFRGRKGGVVDERLRVYGVRGLRVCDASVLPLQVGAHIQASVYAVAEKGAAMVAEDWEQLQKIG